MKEIQRNSTMINGLQLHMSRNYSHWIQNKKYYYKTWYFITGLV